MRARLWFVPLALVAALASGAAKAEPIGPHWQFTPFGGFTIFDSKLRFPGSNLPVADNLHVGGRIGYQTRSWLGFEAAGGFTPTTEDTAAGARDYDWNHLSANLVISPVRGRYANPFAFVGFGTTNLKPAAGDKKSTNTVEFGVGEQWWMTDDVGLRFEVRSVNFKPLVTSGNKQTNYHNVVLGVGLTWALGAIPRDTDGDGVPDKKDKCPATPKGATVDATGCPHDTDGDGVLDGLDKCPDTPKGCTVDANGCSIDSDGDGVCDGLDQCPDTPKGLKVDDKGCPIVAVERETQLFDTGRIRLNDVNFETGKANLLPSAFPALDTVAVILSTWPQIKVEIGGHTDSRGLPAKNLKLSQARADSVRAYLLTRFPALADSQFTIRGYGQTRPVAPNTDDVNRARNRRVEFVVTNKEVLKKVTEKRHLLRQGEPAPADSTQH